MRYFTFLFITLNLQNLVCISHYGTSPSRPIALQGLSSYIWLLATTLQFIFFYGIATVSALLTGNRFAMLLVTAGFNFVSLLLYATVEVIYVPSMVGVVCNEADYFRFSPVVEIFQHKYFTFTRIETHYKDIYDSTKYFYQYDGLSDGWGYLAILGVVGVAAMALGFWLYRKRHLESAGDFIAFPKLKGIACVIMTLCITLCFALLGEALGDGYGLWLIVGLFIGFFGSLMLLERRLKVFRKNTFLGFAAVGFAVVLSLLAVEWDWFGIESWTPKADQVASVTIADYKYEHYGDISTKVEDPADIQRIIDAHKDIYSRMDQPSNKHFQVRLEYKLKSGRTVIRYYYAPAVGDGYYTIRSYLYKPKNILGFTDPAAAAQQVSYMYTSFGEVSPMLYEKLLTALQTEANRGKVAMNGGGTYYVEYLLEVEEGETLHRSLAVTSDAEEVVELMKGPQMLMGYSNWDQFVKTVQQFGINDKRVNQDKKEGLLLAIRQDIEAGCELGGKWVDNCDYVVSYYVAFPNGRTDYREFYITEKATNTMKWLRDNGYTAQ